MHLRRQAESEGRETLLAIRDEIFSTGRADIHDALSAACRISGLGTAGASGLVAILFPKDFGSVDQFVVKALRKIPELPEREALERMNPEGLNAKDGVVLIKIMRAKAASLNAQFGTDDWTPRKIDMVLWGCR